jgi:hypothetical protein
VYDTRRCIGAQRAFYLPKAELAINRSSTPGLMYTCTASDFQFPCALMCCSATPALAASVAPPARSEWNPYSDTSVMPISFKQCCSRWRGVFSLSLARRPSILKNSGSLSVFCFELVASRYFCIETMLGMRAYTASSVVLVFRFNLPPRRSSTGVSDLAIHETEAGYCYGIWCVAALD